MKLAGTRGIVRLALTAPLLAGVAAAAGSIPERLPGGPALPADLRERLAEELASRGPDYRPRTRHRTPDGAPRYTNRLLLEASPYLQQHAHNPVNWFPWGEEAFATAKRLDRPVLVSIGYSTCHWCHVMEEESFEDPETAGILNAGFVAIKVDREARPDVDAIYMAAIHAMRGRGGWPLNVFVTPDRKPFFAGTYFPPEDAPGRRGFKSVLRAIGESYAGSRTEVAELSEKLTRAIELGLAGASASATRIPGPDALVRAAEAVAERADPRWGGIGEQQKFPSSLPIRLLLRYHRRSGDERALAISVLALEKMAAGGLRDHVGGGFHRYSTDTRWLVPHFEKMLYDNALLARAYLEAWQVTKRDDFARITRSTLDYLLREMASPEGGFYSATDADSPGPDGELEEGRFYTWTPAEVEAAVGAEAAPAVDAYYGVDEQGNLDGRTVLHAWVAPEAVAESLGTTPAALERTLAAARERLYAARAQRPAPARDEKILAAWNGFAISAFAQAGFALAEPRYVEAARRCADFALRKLRGADGRLRRVHLDGRAAGPAFLEDYAALIAGLLDLYEVAPDVRWIREAIALQDVLDAHYADALGGGYFQTADDHEALIAREKPAFDGAVPSGNSLAALNLLRLREYTLDDSHLESAVMLFSAFYDAGERQPTAVAELLLAVDYHYDSIKEVVVVRPPAGDASRLLAPMRTTFVPNRILSVVTEGDDLERHAGLIPLVQGRRAIRGETTAYVCANRVCRAPTSDARVFAQQLAEVEPLAAEETP